jgi:hypothetical protein
MRIYVAGFWFAQYRLRQEAAKLRAAGHELISTWLDAEESDSPTPDQRKLYAIRDICEVRKAELFILDTFDEDCRGGREAELGAAYEGNAEIWLVGPQRNIFHTLADTHYLSWDAVHEAIRESA